MRKNPIATNNKKGQLHPFKMESTPLSKWMRTWGETASDESDHDIPQFNEELNNKNAEINRLKYQLHELQKDVETLKKQHDESE